MDGYAGKLLNLNLNDGNAKEFVVPEEIVQKYLGGKGLGMWLLYKGLEPHCDPLGSENVILLMTGPLTGAGIPAMNNLSICTKSPLTGTAMEASVGGDFAIKLKSCGYDGIILRGRSPRPVIIDITEGRWRIRDAGSLWGTNVVRTQELLASQMASILCIGVAGENQVRFATIASGEHTAQRGGAGAVLGSKLVKAIRVGGNFDTSIFDRDKLKGPVESIKNGLKEGAESSYPGSVLALQRCSEKGVLPARNFSLGSFDEYVRITSEAMRSQVKRKSLDCPGCPIACTTEIRLPTRTGTVKIKGPGYQGLAMLGSNLEINDLDSVVRNNYLCYLLGMDPVSTGGTIATAAELAEKGRLDLPLRFGSSREVGPLLPLIAERKGPGSELADGSLGLVLKYGYNDLSMVVKGMDLPGYDPRGCWGQGLAYATSPHGGSQIGSMMVSPEVLGLPAGIPPTRSGGKIKLTIFAQDMFNSLASLSFCFKAGYCLVTVPGWARGLPSPVTGFLASRTPGMATLTIDLFDFYKSLSYVTGVRYDRRTFLRVGTRTFNVERLFNMREGFSSKDDGLPLRFIGEPFREGPISGKVVPLTRMLLRYYRQRGWNEVGIPTAQTLQRLGIEERP